MGGRGVLLEEGIDGVVYHLVEGVKSRGWVESLWVEGRFFHILCGVAISGDGVMSDFALCQCSRPLARPSAGSLPHCCSSLFAMMNRRK